MKKILALLLSLCLLFHLAACKKNETINNTPSNSSQTDIDNSKSDVSDRTETEGFPQTGESVATEETTDTTPETSSPTESLPSESSKPQESTGTPQHTHSYSAATCTTAPKCSCGATSGNALGHSYNQDICSRCGNSNPDKHVHSYSKQTISATCASSGYTLYTCSCGDNYKDNYVSAPHNYKNYICTTCGADYITSFCDRVLPNIKPSDYLAGYITDIQSDGQSYMLNHYKNIVNVSKKLPLNFILDGGDFISGNSKKAKTVQLLKDYAQIVNENDIPYLIAKGNHDDNGFYATQTGRKYDDLITDEEWHSLVTKYYERHSNVVTDKDNPTGGYCYIDDETSKIRTIVVNVCDIPYIKNADGTAKYNAMENYAIREQQLLFIRDALMCSDKENPSEWGIIVTMHFADYATINFKCVIEMLMSKCGKGYIGNQTYCTTNVGYHPAAPEEFVANVDYNFDNNRGDVICIITGHKHIDNENGEKIYGNITLINTDSSLPLKSDYRPAREIGTVDEDCFDIVRVDRTEKKIYCYRFGYGKDREFNYNTYIKR